MLDEDWIQRCAKSLIKEGEAHGHDVISLAILMGIDPERLNDMANGDFSKCRATDMMAVKAWAED